MKRILPPFAICVVIFFGSNPVLGISTSRFDVGYTFNGTNFVETYDRQNNSQNFASYSYEFEPYEFYAVAFENSAELVSRKMLILDELKYSVPRNDDNFYLIKETPISTNKKKSGQKIPEPTTLLLIGSGLLVIVKISKKFPGNSLDFKIINDQEMMASEDMKYCEYLADEKVETQK